MQEYRSKVWKILTAEFFQDIVGANKIVLDLGCGWGEFINQIQADRKYGMDLNPASPEHLDADVQFLEQDCAAVWPLAGNSLDVVFTSNFFEHLPTKEALKETLRQAFAALRPGGKIICLGPNIKFVPGAYWDFLDHHIALTELSLREALELTGFRVERSEDRFLPYTMVGGALPPLWMLRIYLRIPFLWKLKGKQFLLVAVKP